MDKTFKKEFIANGLVAHVIKRKKHKNAISYVIRYRRNGYNISAYGTSLEMAKAKFITATLPRNIENYRKKEEKADKNSVQMLGIEWLKSKEGKIDPRTLRDYKMNCETRIFPKIGQKSISSIRTNDIKEILDEAKGRVVETLQTIFKGIILYAMANGDISYNPMTAIKFIKAKRETRRALTEEEQLKLFQRIQLPEFQPYRKLLLLQYYFGLRPIELTDARFEEDFLIVLNAKHKTRDGNKVYKKIPIPKQARIHIDITQPIECNCALDTLNRIFKKVLQDSTVTQYYLRHTYATTCVQYVRPDIVDTWMGDSSERLVGRVYTHFPDDFMKGQMNKVTFNI